MDAPRPVRRIGSSISTSSSVPSASPLALWRTLAKHHGLLRGLLVREIIGRYRGSVLGLLWSLFNPIAMLLVYTFVFSYVFQARWGVGSDSKTEFALVLFAGLMTYNMFAECCNRAPLLVVGNVSYVKKVVFPLEILPIVSLGASLFHLMVSVLVWLVFHAVFIGQLPPPTALLMPVAILPIILMTLGFTWVLASLGVYLRDVSQVVGVIVTMLLFLSPIFYPVTVMPEQYRPLMQLSPLTSTVEQVRNVMMWGHGLDWRQWALSLAAGLVVASLGFAWFQKTRRGFADVL